MKKRLTLSFAFPAVMAGRWAAAENRAIGDGRGDGRSGGARRFRSARQSRRRRAAAAAACALQIARVQQGRKVTRLAQRVVLHRAATPRATGRYALRDSLLVYVLLCSEKVSEREGVKNGAV